MIYDDIMTSVKYTVYVIFSFIRYAEFELL